MANDVLASRREARRRRILENSENRLQKITGRTDNISKVTFGNEDDSLVIQNGSFTQITNGPVQLPASSSTQIREDDCYFEHPIKHEHLENKDLTNPELDALNTVKDSYQDQEASFTSPSIFEFLYSVKLHLVCLAVLVRIVLFIDYGFLFGECLMAPLCVMEATEVLWLQINKPMKSSSGGLLGAAMLLSGVPPRRVALISDCVQTVMKIGQDACVYFFTFVTFHSVVEWQRNALEIS